MTVLVLDSQSITRLKEYTMMPMASAPPTGYSSGFDESAAHVGVVLDVARCPLGPCLDGPLGAPVTTSATSPTTTIGWYETSPTATITAPNAKPSGHTLDAGANCAAEDDSMGASSSAKTFESRRNRVERGEAHQGDGRRGEADRAQHAALAEAVDERGDRRHDAEAPMRNLVPVVNISGSGSLGDVDEEPDGREDDRHGVPEDGVGGEDLAVAGAAGEVAEGGDCGEQQTDDHQCERRCR